MENSWQLDQLTAASTSGTCPRGRWRRSCQENTGGTLISHRNYFTVDLEQIQGNQHASRLMLSVASCKHQVRGQSDESGMDVFYCSFHGSSVPTAQRSAPCPGLRLGSSWSAWTGVAWPCCGATSEHTHRHTHTHMLRKGIKLFQSVVLLLLLQDVIEPQLKLLFNVTWIRK